MGGQNFRNRHEDIVLGGRRNIHCGNPILDSRSSDVLYAFMPELRNDVILNVAGSHWSVDPVTLYRKRPLNPTF
jgi:hypothetical protein